MIGIYLIHSGSLVSYATDRWGEKTETVTPVRCRVEFETKMVTDKEGNNVWSMARVLLLPTTSVDHDMLFRFNGKDYGILKYGETASFNTLFKELTIA